MNFLVISNRGIWSFNNFLEALDFCEQSFFGRGDHLTIVENSDLTNEINHEWEGP